MLAFIKAMDLVDEQNGLLAILSHILLGMLNRFTNFFNTS